MGRPSKYKAELFEAICERIEAGETLSSICREDGMPGRRTVRDWIEAHDLSARFARARSIGFDALAEECLEIADDERQDWKQNMRGDVNPDETAIARAKLRVWTRMQLLAKWDPKRYGEKIQAEHSGEISVKSIVREVIDPKDGNA